MRQYGHIIGIYRRSWESGEVKWGEEGEKGDGERGGEKGSVRKPRKSEEGWQPRMGTGRER